MRHKLDILHYYHILGVCQNAFKVEDYTYIYLDNPKNNVSLNFNKTFIQKLKNATYKCENDENLP